MEETLHNILFFLTDKKVSVSFLAYVISVMKDRYFKKMQLMEHIGPRSYVVLYLHLPLKGLYLHLGFIYIYALKNKEEFNGYGNQNTKCRAMCGKWLGINTQSHIERGILRDYKICAIDAEIS